MNVGDPWRARPVPRTADRRPTDPSNRSWRSTTVRGTRWINFRLFISLSPQLSPFIQYRYISVNLLYRCLIVSPLVATVRSRPFHTRSLTASDGRVSPRRAWCRVWKHRSRRRETARQPRVRSRLPFVGDRVRPSRAGPNGVAGSTTRPRLVSHHRCLTSTASRSELKNIGTIYMEQLLTTYISER